VNCYEAIDVMGDALEGALAADLRAGLDEHLAECSPCRNYLDQLRLTRQALENLPPSGETCPRRSELIERFRQEIRRGQ